MADVGYVVQGISQGISEVYSYIKNLEAVEGFSLETVYKLPSLSGKVMLPERESFVWYFQSSLSQKKETRNNIVLVEAMAPPVARIPLHQSVISVCIF